MTTVDDRPIVDTPLMYEAFHKIAVHKIRPNPDNPRRDAVADDALIASIKQIGLVEPIIVRPFEEDGEELFMLLAGHRRLDAVIKAGFTRVPAAVRRADEASALEVMLVENLQREDLTPIEEAAGIAALIDRGRSQRQVAELLGVSQSHISKRLSLLKLPTAAREALDAGRITVEQGVTLAKLPSKAIAPLFKGGAPDEYRIKQAVQKQQREEKIDKAKADAEAAGIKVLDAQPGYNRARPPCRLDYLGLEEGFDHTAEPCHAICIDSWSGKTIEVCTEPARHPEPARDEPTRARETAADNETAEQKAKREAKEAHRDMVDAGRERRKTFVVKLLADTPATGLALEVVKLAAYTLPQMSDLDPKDALDLLGVASSWDTSRADCQSYAGDDPVTQLRLVHALSLIAGEGLVRDIQQDYMSDEERQEISGPARRYLNHLRGFGYELDEIEAELAAVQLSIDDVSDDDWEASAKTAPEVTIAPPKGRNKMWVVDCAECGVVGRNTKEDFANEQRATHLTEKHGVAGS